MASSIAEICSTQVPNQKMKKIRTMILTSKVRPDGLISTFPPFGAMAIVQCLIKAGYEQTQLYDLDSLRPPRHVIIKKLLEEKPDIIGISGVVSTAYKNIRDVIDIIHEFLPETIIIIGGNVAVNSEALLKIDKVDYCVVGEGELAAIELLNYITQIRPKRSMKDDGSELLKIKGLCFLDDKGVAQFTNYQKNIPAEELYGIDYDLVEKYCNIDQYIIDPFFYHHFAYSRKSFEPHRLGKKLATIVSTKGCVAKCTFCHRWDHSIRFVPVDIVIERIKYLQKRYNVGYISFSDENWGSWNKWNKEFIEKIKPLDILWRVGGVRTRSVSLDLLQEMEKAGCINVQYGMETGSRRILEVMEKGLKIEDNINAAYWTFQANLYTTYAMVIGMPGESFETIKETAEFLKEVTGFLPEEPFGRLSINRLEALPGTPAYEIAKQKGFVGYTPEAEADYLIWLSDVSAGEFWKQLNLTDYPDWVVQSWKRYIWLEVMNNWYKLHPEKVQPFLKVLLSAYGTFFRSHETRIKLRNFDQLPSDKAIDCDEIDTLIDKNWNFHMDKIQNSFINVRYHPFFYKLRYFNVLEVAIREFLNFDSPKSVWFQRLLEVIKYYGPFTKKIVGDYRSLRKIAAENRKAPISESEKNLFPLQLGR